MTYEPVIGLEVHVELNTKTKMFCRCSADYFGAQPNTHVCPVCMGLPGALPYINREAIEKSIKVGLALNCRVNTGELPSNEGKVLAKRGSYFERKNYFYPDLPKGYQISQLVLPLNVEGWIDVEHKDGSIIRVRINRAHQEEDTGKLTHQGGETLIDYNRSSVPLLEIVTEPDFTDSSQIRDYAKKLQQIFRYLGVSNADMERGDMRLEANVSVRPVGQKELPPYRVELKNINSFRFMVAAVEYEIKRQTEALERGEKLHQETRGWNEDKKETFLQRSKEEANDYRYFPEPDLPEMHISEEMVEEIRASLPELPAQKIERWNNEFGIRNKDGQILAETREQADFFERAVKYGIDKGVSAQQIANVIINQKLDLVDSSSQQVVDDIIAKQANVLDDDSEIEGMAQEVIDENPGMVEQYKSGKENIINALIGQVMRKSQGKANSQKAKDILIRLLQ